MWKYRNNWVVILAILLLILVNQTRYLSPLARNWSSVVTLLCLEECSTLKDSSTQLANNWWHRYLTNSHKKRDWIVWAKFTQLTRPGEIGLDEWIDAMLEEVDDYSLYTFLSRNVDDDEGWGEVLTPERVGGNTSTLYYRLKTSSLMGYIGNLLLDQERVDEGYTICEEAVDGYRTVAQSHLCLARAHYMLRDSPSEIEPHWRDSLVYARPDWAILWQKQYNDLSDPNSSLDCVVKESDIERYSYLEQTANAQTARKLIIKDFCTNIDSMSNMKVLLEDGGEQPLLSVVNLIPNPYFEETLYEDGPIIGWGPWYTKGWQDYDLVKIGEEDYALSLCPFEDKEDSRLGLKSMLIPIEKNASYILGGSLKSLKGNGQAYVGLEWYSTDGARLGVSWLKLKSLSTEWFGSWLVIDAPNQAVTGKILLLAFNPRDCIFFSHLIFLEI